MSKNKIIMKFGGSSVGTPERISRVIQIVRNFKSKGDSPIVVVSAFQGVTDMLISAGRKAESGDLGYKEIFNSIKTRHINAINELVSALRNGSAIDKVLGYLTDLEQVLYGIYLLREISPRSLDYVMSFGERLSAYIISEGFTSAGESADYLDSRKVVKTDNSFGDAKVNFEETNQLIKSYFNQTSLLNVVTGFIGSTSANETTTLGRGGSDYTGAIFGAALDVKEIQIWTDVDGVLTANPKSVKQAFTINELSYDEAMEMSHFGAKVIYPPTIHPVVPKNIPLRIKNTLNPQAEGSLISSNITGKGFKVTGISSIEEVAFFKITISGLSGVSGISGRVFRSLSKQSINFLLISQASSEQSLCFAILPTLAKKAEEIVKTELKYEINEGYISEINISYDVSILSVVGQNIDLTPGIAGKVFQALGRNGINIIAIAMGSSKLNLSTIVKKSDLSKALNAIHDEFFLSDHKTVNLFITGTGLIGRTLFQQIKNQADYLYKELLLDIKIIGIANSKKMIFDTEGISIDDWELRLINGGKFHPDFRDDEFFEKMIELNLSNSIFVDCTSSEKIISKYTEVLSASISIVTPNKKANSSRYDYYLQLRKTAQKHSVSFLYETNVGAGLPVISTLHDLVLSGDKILKIEAVLSGTLSYIFNSFTEGTSFSDIVIDARERGFTEPDPREDLEGLDVARKLLILVREAGYKLELEDIELENLIPQQFRSEEKLESFLERLPELDTHFDTLRREASNDGCRLRYIASYDNGKAKVKLTKVNEEHPFYSLASNDNIISLTTVYYNDRPIVVQGPGAGAKVTSGGILADIVRIGNYL